MQITYATRSGNNISATLQIVAGYSAPFVYTLTSNTNLPDANTGPIESAIVTYYNSLSNTAQATWNGTTTVTTNSSTANTTSSSTTSVTTITRRQFYQELAVQNLISQDESLVALAGTIPPELLTLINSLTTEQQYVAKMALAGDLYFDINTTLVATIAAKYGWTQTQLQDFWTAASLL